MFKNKGSSLVEVVMGASILALMAVAFLGSMTVLSKMHERDTYLIKGDLLAEEGIEALRYIKGSGWSNLSAFVGQTKYLSWVTSSSPYWTSTTTPEIIDGMFYRKVIVSSVARDGNDDIDYSGTGTIDSNILLTQVSVSWKWKGATSTVTYQTYVTNI